GTTPWLRSPSATASSVPHARPRTDMTLTAGRLHNDTSRIVGLAVRPRSIEGVTCVLQTTTSRPGLAQQTGTALGVAADRARPGGLRTHAARCLGQCAGHRAGGGAGRTALGRQP